MMKVAFELTGTMPLLMHADLVEEADKLEAWRKAPENKNVSKPGDDRSPPWTWQSYLYTDGEHVVMPQDNLMVCLRMAATQLILKKQKTFKEISQSGMVMNSEYLTFRNAGKQIAVADLLAIRELPFQSQADAARDLGFRLWIKRARVGQAKHIRVRPRFESWSVSGSVIVTAPEITVDVLQKMFQLAGRVGLCDWRPGCKTPGPFGMFSAVIDG
jgi:hypothetical protein